ncbi:putative polyketide synthase [Triangularia setosa]|uniref:Polyketide synthase n=1 Tax=Triangularia setosa TaxID=2587417 RepID=A0AAN6W114_9PEZI|nr:putative polyketide synthase [Podospora setosa]
MLEASSAPFEPIAIIGMAMRLPGRVRNGNDFWNLLIQKKSGLCDVPKDRFNIDGFHHPAGKPGTIPQNKAYYLEDVQLTEFDTSVFPIGKKELERLDPAQRQLLQVAYECMEDAGVSKWKGSNTGCFVGTYGEDWLDINAKETQHRGGYRGTAWGDFVLGNRVSYEFDLQGPSMTVKTACSSSLVCLDLACQAIRGGECDGALVGGTSLMFSPSAWQTLHDQGLLSPTGTCRTFDAAANGYTRGEAINMIYIKRLSSALRDGDNIRAVIRGTGVNCDGRTQGMTTPSSTTQAALIRRTYETAGIRNLDETAVVECHGTGTPVGDPIEAEAVAQCFGKSGVIMTGVKPNVGHAEGAAGITSIIKCVLALEHKQVPPNINFEVPNPKIRFEECKLHVPTEVEAWPQDRAERVSVNSFGIGGVNAHVILESPRQFGIKTPGYTASTNGMPVNGNGNGIRALNDSDEPFLLLFSAYSAAALQSQIDAFETYSSSTSAALKDLSYTLAHHREPKPYRAFAVSPDLSASALQPSSVVNTDTKTRPKVAWVFTGQGAQWPEMGAELIESHPVFRESIKNLDRFLQSLPNPPLWTIEGELCNLEGSSRVHKAEFGHPLTIALQIALVDALKSWGMQPDLVLGHSSGEMAAAYASGAITAEGAMAAAAFRGTSNVKSDRKGAMAAIGLGREEVTPFLERVPGAVIACDNSQLSVTIAGDVEAVDEVIATLKAEQPGVFARKLRVEKAFHSHHMREYGEDYESQIRPWVKAVEPQIPMFSSVTGKRLTGHGVLEASYWRRNMESPVLFNTALRSALRDVDKNEKVILLEVGPHPALAGPVGQILRDVGRTQDVHVGTLIRNKGCRDSLLQAAGKLFQQNVHVDWKVLCPAGKFIRDVPRYTWQQDTSYWFEPRVAREWRFRENPPHELLGNRVFETTSEPSWRKVLALEDASWLEGHEVNGQTVLPGAGYIAMIGEALRQLEGETTFSLRNVRIAAARVLEMDKTVELVTTLKPIILDASEDSPWYTFAISSFDGNRWTRNCSGEARVSTDKSVNLETDAGPLAPFPRKVTADAWYSTMNRVGLNYQGLFRGLGAISSSTTENKALAEVSVNEASVTDGGRYSIHPAVIDRCFQVFTVAAARGLAKNMTSLVVPTFIGEMIISPCTQDLQVKTSLVGNMSRGAFVGHLAAYSAGQQVIHLKDFRTSALSSGDAGSQEEHPIISQLEWLPHADFTDLAKHMHPVARTPVEWHPLEELILLCSIDHLEQLELVDESPEHLSKFFDWMQAVVERYQAGENLFVPKEANLEALTHVQRLARIDELAAEVNSGETFAAFSTAIHRLFKQAASIVEGETHPLHVLLEDNVLTEFYNTGDVLDYSAAIRIIGNTTPRLRILEVGAGTGGTSAKILKALKSSYGERLYGNYRYTDVSSGFMTAAQKRFAAYENIEYAVLDVSKDPVEQGFAPGTFDLIIGANVIHATPSLPVTLGHLHQLLSPGGRVFLSELCPETMFVNYVMGFLSGWWLGAEDNRAEQPWISPERWTKEFVSAGFQKPEAIVLDYAVPYHQAAGILAAKQSRETVPTHVTLLVHAANGPYVSEMQSSLVSRGILVSLVQFGPEAATQIPEGSDVISLLDLQQPVIHAMTESTFTSLIATLKSLEGTMIWATQASQINCSDPRSSMILGLARTARNDLEIKLFTVELDSETSPEVATAGITKILLRVKTPQVNFPDTKPDFEYAISDGEILVPRLHWQTPNKSFAQDAALQAGERAVRTHIDVKTTGLLHTMHWVSAPVTAPQEDEVLIQPKAAGLNFRDVMIALGILPHNPSEMGFEGAGIVRAVGKGVRHVKEGDRVLYMGMQCFSTMLTMPAGLCVRIEDENMTWEQAAALPGVYVTALIALVDKGRLERGQSVLIHSACGGVGLAAIQIAQWIGAEIFCTVSSEQKTQYLMDNYGIPRSHIFHSRDASFLPDIKTATNDRGVDLVLNSLSGDLLHASWNCVAEFGTMVEIGKRDFLRRNKLPMEPFEQNRTFIGLELRLFSQLQPSKTADLLRRCVDLVRTKKIAGPAIDSVYPADKILDAYRHMQTARHIGKIVITIPENPAALESLVPKPTPKFRADRSYLFAGGLGGLGRSIATWIVEHGARNLIFLSRSAKLSAETAGFVEELKSQGCWVHLVAGSVCVAEDVQRAVDKAPTNKPVAGVLNLSMVLRDVGLGDMTYEDWNVAVEPKVNGTWNLHRATAHLDEKLDFFVLFSSYAGFGGHNGQANYAAGNTFLDAFVQYRHKASLAASVIDVGVMADVGFVARDTRLLERLEKTVMRPVREQELLDTLLLAIERSTPPSKEVEGDAAHVYQNPSQILLGLVTTIPISSPHNLAAWRHDARMSLYYNHERSDQSSASSTDGNSSKSASLKSQLSTATLTAEEKTEVIAKAIASALAKFLIKDEASLPLDKPLETLGIDSLVAMEVRNWIRQQVGVEVTTITIVQSPGLLQLGDVVRKGMEDKATAASA